ncbi:MULTISPECIES: SDR family NAD(P)-dependent oxidoreductase [Micromonospora]|uniref:SDR family oxidoreductase n=1 Tax=Micromonospora solifontis TaxID=2487138 RepID=A0ABX9WIB7_9ACTN|nr:MULTISPECIES: SDR family oxidoreductase [Micromonospora]NES13957.1 SDR family oxidoreductase [Micromonospora sp. PPF5-17B]NES37484.1 SDR family oxidoreductase [Micromonospora solifontis]NES54057.1 SDR family oxidoreductase [Micromonospora sp. PPF5-6]RNL98292.1 SDR family oxidoreductase [Micromonospora solifontis]
MTTLDGKVALVTGGGRGIGAATAVRLAAEGADVALTYETNAERAAVVGKQIEATGRRALVLAADSADPEAVRAAVDRTVAELGRLDILVNNAAVFLVGPVDGLGRDELDRTLAVNVRAPYLAAQAAARNLGAGGRIINIGSNVARRAPFPGLALYSMSKTALVGLTKGLGRELGPRGITVNLVNPGPTDTDANPADGPNAQAVAGLTALGRYAAPAEIAAVVAHLAGPDAGYVTGAVIDADGGFAI